MTLLSANVQFLTRCSVEEAGEVQVAAFFLKKSLQLPPKNHVLNKP